MNDSELDAKLKAAREPALPPGYQEAFTQMVLKNLRSSPGGTETGRATRRRAGTRQRRLPALAWALATTACILIAFAIGHWRGRVEANRKPDVLTNARFVEETLAMFPNQIRAIVQDQDGTKLVLSDKNNVPASTPIYVRICNGQNCASLVTFSGQQIEIAGQTVTVLSQGNGGIIVEGSQFVWSNQNHVYAERNLKIEAKNLGTAAM